MIMKYEKSSLRNVNGNLKDYNKRCRLKMMCVSYLKPNIPQLPHGGQNDPEGF